jgi:hypothetical protein
MPFVHLACGYLIASGARLNDAVGQAGGPRSWLHAAFRLSIGAPPPINPALRRDQSKRGVSLSPVIYDGMMEEWPLFALLAKSE